MLLHTNQARGEAENLTKQIHHAQVLLSDFLCHYFDSPLAEKAFHSDIVEYKGREIDVDHEYTDFESGDKIVDGEVWHGCRNITANKTTMQTRKKEA
jgi:hypothetical protein